MNPLELAVEHSTDGILLLKGNNIIFCNRTFSRMLGLRPQDLKSKSYWSYFEKKERLLIEKKLNQGIRFELELDLKKSNKQYVAVEAHYNPSIDKNGEIECWVAVHKRIEHRKGLRDSISRLSEHLRLVAENAPLTTWSIDTQGEIQYVSEKGMPGLKKPKEELMGNSLSDIYVNDPFWLKTLELGLKGEKTYSENLIGNDHFETFFAQIKDNKHKIIGLSAVSIDITEKVKTAAFKRRLTSILEATSDTVILFNNKEITYINQAGKNLLGFEDLPNQGFESLIESSAWIELRKEAIPIADQRGLWNGESSFVDVNNLEIPISMVLIAHKNKEGEIDYYSVIARDIRKAKEHERELETAKEKAEAATKAKSVFLANMSHEIRTPLNAILGFSEILTQSTEDPALKDYTKAIRSSGKNLLHLISDILDLSKIESGNLKLEPQPTNPTELIKEIQTIFELQAQKKGLGFEVHTTIQSSLLHLDATRLRQVLFNIVGNAIKYTNKGWVQLSSKEIVKNNSSSLIFTIKDTGQGISKQHQEEIFETFVQKHDASGGAGLGLAITKRLVSAMDGNITLNSELGKGSEFTVQIDNLKIEHSPKCIPHTDNDSQEIIFDNASVLVVDDLETNIEILRAFLTSTNLKVIEASNGYDALKLAELYKPDLILMDLKMPDMDGITATKKIKENQKTNKIPIVALTAQPLPEEKNRVLQAGAQGFLRKPISRNRLLSEIKKYLNYSEKIDTENIYIHNEFEKPDQLNPIINTLKGELLNEWNRIQKSHVIGDIKKFSEKLNAKGSQYNWLYLKNYSKKINDAASSYNIDKCHEILNQYPEILKKLS